MTLFQKTVMSFLFFQLRDNLEKAGSWIPDAYSVKLSLIVTFYMTKTGYSSHTIALSRGFTLAKKR